MSSQLKSETKEIDGIEFTVVQFPAMKALEVMVSLQRSSLGANPNASISQAASAMAGMDPSATKKMVLDVLACTTALVRNPDPKLIALNDQKGIDLVFSGKLRTLFRVIEFAVEVNYGDFKEGSEESAPLTLTQDQ